MSTPVDVRRAIRDALKTIPTLNTSPGPPDQINPPAAIVMPLEFDPHASFGSGSTALKRAEAEVLVLVSNVFTPEAVDILDRYANTTGSDSVVYAIEADPTLGGVVESATVTGLRGLRPEEANALSYFGGTFTIQVAWR